MIQKLTSSQILVWKGDNKIHLNVSYSVTDHMFTIAFIQPGVGPDILKAFCSKVDVDAKVDANTGNKILRIYIADCNFTSYNDYVHVIQSGQYFAIRCSNDRLHGILGRPVEGLEDLDCWVSRILS